MLPLSSDLNPNLFHNSLRAPARGTNFGSLEDMFTHASTLQILRHHKLNEQAQQHCHQQTKFPHDELERR